MVHVIIKQTESDLEGWLATEAGFISGAMRYEDTPIVLEPYQLSLLSNRARFRWITKSRQVGYSFVFALEALARCHLRDGHTTVFVSFNQADAIEKILLARQVFEEMPAAYQKRLVTDAKTELAFESNGAGRRLSCIISVPSKAPRGKKGDILLDELAHLVNDREVYTGSTALILRSNGQLTGCSTPLGRRGIFWEIATEELRKYPHHSRQEVPWWLCSFFCTDVGRAAVEAPAMPTEERVATFGRPALVEQFDSLPLDDFQQEFEDRFVDESFSFYSYELILPCTSEALVLCNDVTDVGEPKGRLVAGYDVGRMRDRSELAPFDDRDGRMVCWLLRRYDKVPFQERDGRHLAADPDRDPAPDLAFDVCMDEEARALEARDKEAANPRKTATDDIELSPARAEGSVPPPRKPAMDDVPASTARTAAPAGPAEPPRDDRRAAPTAEAPEPARDDRKPAAVPAPRKDRP